jgi:hypothetical protein
MALPEFKPVSTEIAPVVHPAPITAPLPHAALQRLPQLHEESRLAMRRAGLLSRAVPAAGTLLAMGSIAALFGGGALGPVFFWSVAVLGGIVAIVASHLRTTAVFKDMAGSAADLRAILLYLGIAWGLGAFLTLAPAPSLLVAFAAIPVLALALLLRDGPAILAFAGPATLLTLAALILRTQSWTAAAILLLAQAAIAAFLFHRRQRGAITPPGFVLR